MTAPRFLFTSILCVSLLTACSGKSETTASTTKGAGGESASGANRGTGRSNSVPRKVNTTVATEKAIEDVAVVTGTLAAEQDIQLGVKVAGKLAEINVDLGSAVKKGDVIARIDTTDFDLRVRQADAALQQALVRLGLPLNSKENEVDPESLAIVKQAKANLEVARSRKERAELQDRRGLIAKADLDTAESVYRVAEAVYEDAKDEARNRQAVLLQRRSEFEIARQQLDDTVLYSPIDGMVRLRQANVGQYLAVGAPIVTIVQMNPIRLRAAVPERQAKNVRLGQLVRVSVEGVPGYHEGKVVRISPAVDETNRTLMVEAAVSNADAQLKPGAFAKSEIVVATGQKSLMVPPAAVATFAGVERVFVVKNGKASEKRVKTGRRSAESVEILEGLSEGEQIVINPGDLNDGDNVTTGATSSMDGLG